MAVRILKGHGPQCDLTNSDLVNDNNAFIKNDGAGFTNPHAYRFAPDAIVGAVNPPVKPVYSTPAFAAAH